MRIYGHIMQMPSGKYRGVLVSNRGYIAHRYVADTKEAVRSNLQKYADKYGDTLVLENPPFNLNTYQIISIKGGKKTDWGQYSGTSKQDAIYKAKQVYYDPRVDYFKGHTFHAIKINPARKLKHTKKSILRRKKYAEKKAQQARDIAYSSRNIGKGDYAGSIWNNPAKKKRKIRTVAKKYYFIKKSKTGKLKTFKSTMPEVNKKYYNIGKGDRIYGPFTTEKYAKHYLAKTNPPKAYPGKADYAGPKFKGKKVVIYDKITKIEAKKGKNSLWPKENFVHSFKGASEAEVLGNPDGSLLIRSKTGKPLHKLFDY